jgi:immunity protein, SdpI family
MRIRWYVELPQWLILGLMFAIAVTSWNQVPLPMPVHWSGDVVDGFGGKFQGLLMWPLIAVGLYLLLLFAPRYNDRGAIAFSGTTLDPDAPSYRRVIEPLYHLARIGALGLIAVIYAAQVRFAKGYPVDMETINRYGLIAILGITGMLAVAMILFFGKPQRYS